MLRLRSTLACVLAIGAFACSSEEAPTGQVAATLDGEEFTFLQINQELGMRGNIAPEQRDQASREALRRILQLHIIAEEASNRGLDATPAGAAQLERLEKNALGDLLRADIRSSVPQPSDEEAAQFVADNRVLFAERSILIVRQLVVPEVSSEVIAAMEPIDTLPGIESLLNENAVVYRKTMGTVDFITLAPEVASQIADLAVGDVYVIPQGAGARVNLVVSKEEYPINGEDATRVAKEVLFERRVNGQIESTLRRLVADRMKDVNFAAEFQPNASNEAAEIPAESQGQPVSSADS